VAIKFRPSYEYMTCVLLFAIANGVALLVRNALSSQSIATGVGLLAAAIVLLLVFTRIWRGTTDATRWTALILAVISIPAIWLRMS
jgi:hypothetical protein